MTVAQHALTSRSKGQRSRPNGYENQKVKVQGQMVMKTITEDARLLMESGHLLRLRETVAGVGLHVR